jgi:phage terminase small subunit
MALNAKQKLFCENYVSNGYKLTQAYMDAFGVSYEVANANQWRLMKKDAIKGYIAELQHERFEALGMNADRIAKMLTDIATDPDASRVEQMKALELIQKQMGLQTQKVDATVKTTVIEVDIDGE